MTSADDTLFIETGEYRRFMEFCDACRHYRYIGLCYGAPGVGKTLSARHYAKWDNVESYKRLMSASGVMLKDVLGSNVVFYTVPVVNTPKKVEEDIRAWRKILRNFLIEELYRKKEQEFDRIRQRETQAEKALHAEHIFRGKEHQQVAERTYAAIRQLDEDHSRKNAATADPTVLLIIDEADRQKMAALEQVRAIFDHGDIGVVLIGMPGLEKRLARYPQLYSRIGFVHAFRPLSQSDIRRLLQDRWRPAGVGLPDEALEDEEGLATIIRVTGGNFRLLDRLLTQIGRVLEINRLDRVTREVVDAARESLVIGVS